MPEKGRIIKGKEELLKLEEKPARERSSSLISSAVLSGGGSLGQLCQHDYDPAKHGRPFNRWLVGEQVNDDRCGHCWRRYAQFLERYVSHPLELAKPILENSRR